MWQHGTGTIVTKIIKLMCLLSFYLLVLLPAAPGNRFFKGLQSCVPRLSIAVEKKKGACRNISLHDLIERSKKGSRQI